MKYSKQDIDTLDRITKLKIINSITGIKPANLIGTINEDKQSNLAIFSSVVHLGSDPALLGFIARPRTEEVGHTYHNIINNGSYTINHIQPEFMKNAHYTSAKFDTNISEFQRCGLTEEYIDDCLAPFVKESAFKIEMKFKDTVDIPLNGTTLVIGEVQTIIFSEVIIKEGDINLETANSIGISGLNSYYSLQKIGQYPYVREEEVPDFTKSFNV